MWEKIYSTAIGGSLVSGQAGTGNLTTAERIDHRLPLSLGLLQCGEDLPDPLTNPGRRPTCRRHTHAEAWDRCGQ